MRLIALAVSAAIVSATGARADAPNVVTDIPAVHSLVAQIMDGVGAPDLLIRPGASPHGYSMRPSEAEALQNADVVFWIGEDLTPWLHESIEAVAANARSIELLEAEGTETLEFRESAVFEDDHDDHGHGHDHDKDHAEGAHDHDKDEHAGHGHGDEHAEHDHDKDEHAGHGHGDEHAEHDHDKEEHAEGHGHEGHGHGHEGHSHDGVDPHAWLDPQNAMTWLNLIAAELSAADPGHAADYAANLETALAGMKALSGEIETAVAPVRGKPFIVFHDAYHYFEHRFDVETAGAVSVGDASAPSAQRVAAIKDLIEDRKIVCVFSEPQFEPKLVQTVIEGTSARTAVLDPLGADLALGKDLYGELLNGLAQSMAGCLTQ